MSTATDLALIDPTTGEPVPELSELLAEAAAADLECSRTPLVAVQDAHLPPFSSAVRRGADGQLRTRRSAEGSAPRATRRRETGRIAMLMRGELLRVNRRSPFDPAPSVSQLGRERAAALTAARMIRARELGLVPRAATYAGGR